MNKFEQLLQTGFAIAFENTSFAGKIFEVVVQMKEEPFTKLQYIGEIGNVITAVDNFQTRVYSITESIRELREYCIHNDFVMLPNLVRHYNSFVDFWNNPVNYGGCKEPLEKANKKPLCFSILQSNDVVYHIPIALFAELLQGEPKSNNYENKFLGFDFVTQTYWIAQGQQQLFECPMIIKDDFELENEDYVEVDLEEKLKEIVAFNLGVLPDTIENETSLGSELNFVDILMDIEEQLDCRLPDPEIPVTNFAELMNFIICYLEE